MEKSIENGGDWIDELTQAAHVNVNVNVEAVLVTVGFGDGWVGEAFGSSVCHVRAGSRSSAGKSCVSLIDHCARLIDWGSSPSARQDSSELVIAIGRVDSAPFHSSILKMEG